MPTGVRVHRHQRYCVENCHQRIDLGEARHSVSTRRLGRVLACAGAGPRCRAREQCACRAEQHQSPLDLAAGFGIGFNIENRCDRVDIPPEPAPSRDAPRTASPRGRPAPGAAAQLTQPLQSCCHASASCRLFQLVPSTSGRLMVITVAINRASEPPMKYRRPAGFLSRSLMHELVQAADAS